MLVKTPAVTLSRHLLIPSCSLRSFTLSLRPCTRSFASTRNSDSGTNGEKMVVDSKKDPKDAKEGERVAWNFGGSRVEGEVANKKEDKLTIESKGKPITKQGEKGNPAVHVKRKGNDVVKKASELAVLDKEEDIPKGEKVMTRAQAKKVKDGDKS